MSSFKRKTTLKQQSLPSGTRLSSGSTSTVITSTGIPSLDDILGRGLPLSCSLLVLAPDVHSAYGELVQKYFIAQGLACGQKLCIVDDNARDFLAECMWLPGSTAPALSSKAEEDEDEKADEHDAKIKIAWRYKQMKQFQTTVSTTNQSTEDYCRVFDLTCRIPQSVIGSACSSNQFLSIGVSSPDAEDSLPHSMIIKIAHLLETSSEGTSSGPFRICIPSLGSSQWGDLTPQEICYFLYSLRALLRRHPHACAAVSLPPHLCTDAWGGAGWVQKLGWLSDASIALVAFTANPALTSVFSSHHGLVRIHSLPSPHTLLPPSDKFSTLRGLSSSGENNLAFKCMRKRLIFETLHFDLEGGVGERRTTPAGISETNVVPRHDQITPLTPSINAPEPSGSASVEVRLEQVQQIAGVVSLAESMGGVKAEPAIKKTKLKKKVAFTSDRPDLYDF
ncbi:hypothetical protein AcW2_000712 [Taiwanofungus camphoratus]|nr:hypothetical protein AcW2_000712 [Antrodia cinnamomea]